MLYLNEIKKKVHQMELDPLLTKKEFPLFLFIINCFLNFPNPFIIFYCFIVDI